jgi:hypothetical protein
MTGKAKKMDSTLKKKMFELLYREGDVHILISATVNGVRIPSSMAASAKDKLIGFVLGMKPSPRLEIRESGLFAPLRFGEERFRCFFPWESVLQMNSKDCVVFFAKGEKEEDLRPEGKKGRPRLTVVRKETAG